MSFQQPPPPPPPGENPPPPAGNPPPPPGQWGPPPGGGYPAAPGGGRPAVDARNVNPLDWGILGAGVLAFIFSLFDYYTVSLSFAGYHQTASFSAWHGFFGWFAALLALAGGVLVASELFVPQFRLPVASRLAALGLFAVATLCVILALFIFPGGDVSGPGVDEGRGFSYWVSLVVIVVGLVLSLMRLQQTGGTLPGPLASMPNIGGYGPQGGLGGPGAPGDQGGYQGGPGNQPPPPGYDPRR